MYSLRWYTPFFQSQVSASRRFNTRQHIREEGPSRYSRHPPEHHLKHYLFSLERNPVQQHSISKEATEKSGSPLCLRQFGNRRMRIDRWLKRIRFQSGRPDPHDLFRHCDSYPLGDLLTIALLFNLYLAVFYSRMARPSIFRYQCLAEETFRPMRLTNWFGRLRVKYCK